MQKGDVPPGSHNRIVRRELSSLDTAELAPGVHLVDGGRIIVHLAEDGTIRAAKNRCIHQGGRFVAEGGCQLRCPRHGWALDAARMTYTNPTGGLVHPELGVERHGTRVTLFEDVSELPWDEAPAPAEPLAPGELDVTYYTHACVRIRAGGSVLFTDPWLEGPAFTRGWWLMHEPPAGALEELARADLIYISHNHSDHLNPTTLRRLSALNPDAPIIVPRFEVGDAAAAVQRHGLRNVRAVPFDEWFQVAPRLRLMLLRDGAAAGDSGVLVEYAGHRILDSVDCSDLNGGVLPSGVDLLLGSFSRGASGYPVCWGELIDGHAMRAWLKQDALNVLLRVCDSVKRSRARAFLPIASFFVEAHPADAAIRELNVKTTAREVCEALARSAPATWTIDPRPGDCVDLHDLSVKRGPPARTPTWNFAEHLARVEACRRFEPLEHAEGLLHYFEWAGYRGDLILHVVETDDAFEPSGKSWLIDLAGPRLLAARPAAPHRYLRLRVRGDVFRHTLRYGLPWDEISIGFNARMYREPNAYNRDFWSHFQNCLPATPPFGEAAPCDVAPVARANSLACP